MIPKSGPADLKFHRSTFEELIVKYTPCHLISFIYTAFMMYQVQFNTDGKLIESNNSTT